MNVRAVTLLVALILIPVLLTDPLERPKQLLQALAPTAKSPTQPVLPPAPTRVFQAWNDPSFDREGFLASFRRQSALGLRDCLISENLKERAFSASATLDRNGQLSQLRWNNEEPLPKCVIATIRAMSFRAQSSQMTHAKVELQWRVDW